MRLGVASVGGWVSRQSLRRGLLGSSRVWFAVFVATRAVRLARRMAGSRPAPVVYSETLEPGSTLEIRHLRRRDG